jgi:hypothetical protein
MKVSIAVRRFVRMSGFVAALGAWTSTAQAEVKKIVIDTKVSPAFDGQAYGTAGRYETLADALIEEAAASDVLQPVQTTASNAGR